MSEKTSAPRSVSGDAHLTPAGIQVERALADGYPSDAFDLYLANLRDEVPMEEGEWPDWHRIIQRLVGWHSAPSVSDEEAEHEPSLIEQRIRNSRGEIKDVKLVPNPHAASCECDLCAGAT